MPNSIRLNVKYILKKYVKYLLKKFLATLRLCEKLIKRTASMRDKYSNTRRGVLLLLVLCILALFALVAVAFVLISGQSQRSAKNMQRMDQTLEDPQKLMNEAMMQVARGTINPTSVLGPHSLLEDMYGNNFVIASITGV